MDGNETPDRCWLYLRPKDRGKLSSARYRLDRMGLVMVEPELAALWHIQQSALLVDQSKRHVQQLRQSIAETDAALDKSVEALNEGSRLVEELDKYITRRKRA